MIDPTLKVIADNPALFEALQKHIMAEFDDMGEIKLSDSNEILGQLLKASVMGRDCVKDAFKKISHLKSTNEQGIRRNEAR